MRASKFYERARAHGWIREAPLACGPESDLFEGLLQRNGGPFEGFLRVAEQAPHDLVLEAYGNPFLQQHQTARLLLGLVDRSYSKRIFEERRAAADEILRLADRFCAEKPEFTDEFSDLSAIAEWARGVMYDPNDRQRVIELAGLTRSYPKRFTLHISGGHGLYERGAVIGAIAAASLLELRFDAFDSLVGIEVAAMKSRGLDETFMEAMFDEIVDKHPNCMAREQHR